MTIKWLGAGYLIYIGLSLGFAKASMAKSDRETINALGRSNWSLFAQGFMIVATNPKVLMFFTAFLPQFYAIESTFWSQYLVLAGTFVIIEITLELFLAAFASKIAR